MNSIDIQIQFYIHSKSGNHRLTGVFDATILRLIESDGVYKMQNIISDDELLVEVIQCNVTTIPSFLDYINAGLDMNLLIGVDFTASNGNPQYQNSLHYIGSTGNQYLNAIDEVSRIVLNFDSDKNVPMFGFGGVIPKYYTDVSH